MAIAVTTVACLTGAFYIITASAPLWQYLYLSISSRLQMMGMFDFNKFLPGGAFIVPQCPYKSPQAWLALRLFLPVIDWTIFHYYSWVRRGHRPNSWVSFDAYWTARRDAEAAETTTSRALLWTANVLGETHLNAWRVLCARQDLAQALGSMHYRAAHAEDLMQDLLVSVLKNVNDAAKQARTRRQVVLFSLSCQPDLDINASVESFLHLAANTPFDPEWFGVCLRHIWRIFSPVQHILNDGKQLASAREEMLTSTSVLDLAIELLRVIHSKLSSDHTSLQNIQLVCRVLGKTVDILNWAPSRTLFLSVVCAVAVRFLHSSAAADHTPRERAEAAHSLLWSLKHCELPFRTDIRQLRGFGNIVALAQFILDNDPTCIDDAYSRKVLDDLGLRYLHDRRLPSAWVQHGSDNLRSDTVSGASRNLSVHCQVDQNSRKCRGAPHPGCSASTAIAIGGCLDGCELYPRKRPVESQWLHMTFRVSARSLMGVTEGLA